MSIINRGISPNAKIAYSKLSTTGSLAQKGFIHLPLGDARGISSNDIPVKAVASGSGGALAKDSTPILERTNGATDKSLRIDWAATDVTEITWSGIYPPDADLTQAVTVKILAKMSSTNDTPVVAVGYWEGIGGSNLGGNTAALAPALGVVSKAITPAGAIGTQYTVTLTPGTHGTDAIYMHGAWLEYTKLV